VLFPRTVPRNLEIYQSRHIAMVSIIGVAIFGLSTSGVQGFHAPPLRTGTSPALMLGRKTGGPRPIIHIPSSIMATRGGVATMSGCFAAAAALYCPLIGCVTSFALNAAPLMAILERAKVGTMGSLNPLPAAMTVLASIAWLQYGFSVANPFVVAANLPGLVAAFTGFVIVLPLMKDSNSLKPVQAAIVGGAASTAVLWTYLVFSRIGASVRSTILGYYATCFFLVLAASPLSAMKNIISKRDSAAIYAPATLAQILNCGLWTFYGLVAAKDVFVWGPNLVALILGLAQLSLKLIFPSK
jgi:solute carrier family 50 protein (sugar transporter)